MPPPHPLRRVSTGSLSSLARSQDRSRSSPSGLDFLAPAMTDLADEASTLAINTQKLNELHDALGTFNEAFAGWMYALKMNAFCVEWEQAPSQQSFERIAKLEEEQAAQAQSQLQLSHSHNQSAIGGEGGGGSRSSRPSHAVDNGDMTYATASSFDDGPPVASATSRARPTSSTSAGAHTAGRKVPTQPGAGVTRKPGAPAGPTTAAARRKRDLEVSGYMDMLPLEYRGQDATLRLGMEKVINKLLNKPEGYTLQDMISLPDLPQTKANKHLQALVTRKLVAKESAPGGKAVYRWLGV